MSQVELELRSLPALKNQAQRLAMKLDLSKSKQTAMLQDLHKRAELTEQRAMERRLWELQNKRGTPKYRRDPICINGYMVGPKKGSVDQKRERAMKDQIFYMQEFVRK